MAEETPWHAAYPKPRNKQPPSISAEDLLSSLKSGQKPGVDLLLIDLRRHDHEGGTIKGSLNLPAQSLYPSLPMLLDLCQNAKTIRGVIFYCGSSRGRGTRAAGWFDDLIQDRGLKDIKSLVLENGIAGWAHSGVEFTEWMEEYDSKAWKS